MNIYAILLVYLLISIITLILWTFTRTMGLHSKSYYYAILVSTVVIFPVFLIFLGYYWYLKRGLNLKTIAFFSFPIPPLAFFLVGGVAARFDENRALDKKEGDLYTYIKNERLEKDKGLL